MTDKKISEQILIVVLILQLLFMCYISQKRFFSFDEPLFMYSSASMVKGKALYSDHVNSHFPLANILFYFFIKVWGFDAAAMLIGRIIATLLTFFTLFMAYRIAATISGRRETGILAVVLAMSSIAFINRGVEIRHDVFSMFFNTAAALYAIRYIKDRKLYRLIFSGIFIGCALASTQKAFAWSTGIVLGTGFAIFREYGIKNALKLLLSYSILAIFPLLVSILFLVFNFNETFYGFFQDAILCQLGYLMPDAIAKAAHPFPYSKMQIFGGLLYQNGVFYLLSIAGIFLYIFKYGEKNDEKEMMKNELHYPLYCRYIIFFWALFGILFYLYMKRPFDHSLMPTVPIFGIISADLLIRMRENVRLNLVLRQTLYGLALILLLVLPSFLIFKDVTRNFQDMSNTLKNISFCLNYLKPEEKVLCFSHQQVYFDAIFDMYRNDCGDTFLSFDADCFEKKMIQEKCKIVIYDYITASLNKNIQQKIMDNYRQTGIGEILIPGFILGAGEEITKNLWIPGMYYVDSLEINIDGAKINNNMIEFSQKTYTFKNPTSKPVLVIYVFYPKNVPQQP